MINNQNRFQPDLPLHQLCTDDIMDVVFNLELHLAIGLPFCQLIF